MLSKKTYLIVLLIVSCVSVQAELGNFIEKKVTINEVITSANKISISYTENGKKKNLNYVNALLEDELVYYLGTVNVLPLKDILLGKQYFIMIRDNINPNTRKIKSEIYYIGTVPYPF